MATRIPTHCRLVVIKREQYRCGRCGSLVPGQWHHRRSRSVRDDWQHHWTNGVWLDPDCHRWVHANPVEARRTGFIVSRFNDYPGDVPIKLHSGWVLLDLLGGYRQITEEVALTLL